MKVLDSGLLFWATLYVSVRLCRYFVSLSYFGQFWNSRL